MGTALEFDGQDDYASFIQSGLAVGDTYKIRAKANTGNSGGAYRILGRYDGYASLIEMTSTNVNVRMTDQVNHFSSTGYVQPAVGVWFEIELVRVDSTNYDVKLDGATIGSFTSSSLFMPNAIAGFNNAFFFSGQIEYITNGLVNNWDAGASNHTAGTPVLTDTIGGNNATGVNMPTAAIGQPGSAWIDLGGGGITLLVTESGPSFTESINTTLTAAINAVITESGPSFTESISVTLTAKLNASIIELGPAFTESISATVTPSISVALTEQGPSFTESISATVTTVTGVTVSITEVGPSFTESINALLGVNLNADITEQGPSFTESATVSVTKEITLIITETGPSFTESINVTLPITITVNPKNVIQVKRKSNTVIIKGSNREIKVKPTSKIIRVR